MKRNQHLANMEREKITSEQQSAALKRQLDQQMKIGEMIKSVQDQSNNLEAIMKASIKEKEATIELRQNTIIDLEKKVNEKVMGLLLKQKDYNEREEKLGRMQKEVIEFQEQKKLELDTERRKVEENSNQLQNLYNQERAREHQAKEEVEIMKKKIEYEEEKLRRIDAQFEEQINERVRDLEMEHERLAREKKDHEEMQREDDKRVSLKQYELEERKKALNERESKHLKQRQNLEAKEETVRIEMEQLQ